ncbi:MAG: DNA cytosine methyltransferase [Rhodobacteraceae bacterium]|nr:DNA cytosine methyltransferase [Paracoccaceae bacterium]
MNSLDLTTEIRVGHLCCGSGFGARGFRKANARVGSLKATFRNIGGIDIDAAGIRDFEQFAGCKGTVLDLMDLEQYRAFHAAEPPAGWREAMPADIHRAMGGERPHIWFVSAPCKGFSGLLSETASKAIKYQALNQLTLRAVWLALEAYKDDPVEFILFENVPRIANRGRPLLDKIQALLAAYGYATAETTHDCGELGGLAQSRKRFLLVGRHREKVPPFLYEPPKRPLRGVGEVLDKLPVPGGDPVHPMHRLPRLQWKTWVRLAFVEAGSDWRSLNKLAVENGHLADYLIVPDMRGGVLGVNKWGETAGTVAGRSLPTCGAYSVADPRAPAGAGEYGQYGVRPWGETSGAVINVKSPGQGCYAVADPRHGGPAKHSNEFRIIPFDGPARAVTSAHGTGQCVADPRASGSFEGGGKYRVTAFDEASGTVIAGSTTGQGAFAVADPRPAGFAGVRGSYQTQGHYGVTTWDEPSGAVPGFAKHDRGRWSVADPRLASIDGDAVSGLPAPDERLTCRIEALDGTWHRPFTTLELAALQSLFDPEEWSEFAMDGASDSAWRERIGNAVPSDAAQAIAGVMGRTLLLAWTGETFMLSADPIWVQPLTVALSVDVPELATVREAAE